MLRFLTKVTMGGGIFTESYNTEQRTGLLGKDEMFHPREAELEVPLTLKMMNSIVQNTK